MSRPVIAPIDILAQAEASEALGIVDELDNMTTEEMLAYYDKLDQFKPAQQEQVAGLGGDLGDFTDEFGDFAAFQPQPYSNAIKPMDAGDFGNYVEENQDLGAGEPLVTPDRFTRSEPARSTR